MIAKTIGGKMFVDAYFVKEKEMYFNKDKDFYYEDFINRLEDMDALCKRLVEMEWGDVEVREDGADWEKSNQDEWKKQCYYYHKSEILEAGINKYKKEILDE